MAFVPLSSRTPVTVALAACLAMVTAACASDDSAPKQAPPASASPPATRAPAPSLDACTLLTKGEAEAALGQPVKDPVRGDVAPVFSCSFAAANGFNSVSLNVMVYTDARQAHDAYVMALKINNYKEIPGLGDRAYTSPVHDVTVLKGRYEVGVDVSTSMDSDAELKASKEIATRALERLPQ